MLLKRILRPRDSLIMHKLDRLERNKTGIRSEWDYFMNVNININIIILDMPVLNTKNKTDLEVKLISEVMLSLLSYLSEKERKLILKRQAEGIEIAKSNRVYRGHKRKKAPNFPEIYEQWKQNNITALYACQKLGISSPTFYRRVRDIKRLVPRYLNYRGIIDTKTDNYLKIAVFKDYINKELKPIFFAGDYYNIYHSRKIINNSNLTSI